MKHLITLIIIVLLSSCTIEDFKTSHTPNKIEEVNTDIDGDTITYILVKTNKIGYYFINNKTRQAEYHITPFANLDYAIFITIICVLLFIGLILAAFRRD